MSITDQIRRIKNAKAAIKQSIENKGVTVSDEAKIGDYAALIDNIEVGSGGSGGDSEYEHPEYYEARTYGGISYKGLFAYTSVDVDFSLYDSSEVTNMDNMFYMFGVDRANHRTVTNLNSLDFSKVRSACNMFGVSYVDNIDLSGASFPELTDASKMAYNLYSCKTVDFSNVDMPKVTNASYMFSFGSGNNVTAINLTGINMPNIINASSMFEYCNKITSLDLSGINFSNATNVNSLFANCKLLVEIIGELDCSSVSNGLYNSSYGHSFYNCNALETLYLKNIYKNVTMTNLAKWSINLGTTKVKDECLIYIINELPDLINDKGLTATDKIVFTLPPTNTLTEEQKQVARDKGWQVVN